MFSKKREHKQILDSLRTVAQNNYMIFFWGNGEMAGLCPPESDQTYYDERFNTKRKRLKYWELNGEKNLVQKDGLSQQRETLVDLLPIETSGGLALSKLNSDGDVIPLYTGNKAKNIKQKIEHFKSKVDELEDIQDEYRTKDRNYRKLQNKIDNLKEEKRELEEGIEELRTTSERLNNENESYKARNMALLSWKRQLTQELKAMEDRHEELEDDIKSIREKAEDSRIAELTASGVDGEVPEPSEVRTKMAGEEPLEEGGGMVAEGETPE